MTKGFSAALARDKAAEKLLAVGRLCLGYLQHPRRSQSGGDLEST